MSRNSQRPRGSRRGGRIRGLGRAGDTRLPPFVPTLSLSHKFRFQNGANSGSYTITRGNLLNLLLVTPSAITSARILQAVRLKRVSVWANPSALGAAPTEIELEWFGENSPSTTISDSTMGVRPAHIDSAPPPSSSNRWWSISGTLESDPMFAMVLPADCIIDVTLELRLVEAEAPTAGDVPAGATIGRLYGDYLDGIASAKLSPLGLAILP